MKARIKKTGEVVNIADYAKVTLDRCDSWGNPLEYPLDEVEIIEEKADDIDWGEVRIKAAISALQGFASNPNSTSASDEELAKWSVNTADVLIAELKKGGTQ